MLDIARLEEIIGQAPHWLQGNPDFQRLASTLRSALAPENNVPASSKEPLAAYCDGSSLGNPGPAGWAAVYATADGQIRGTISRPLAAHATSQAAEIVAATMAILNAPSGGMPLIIHTDSQYVVGTMNEHWRRKANHERWAALDKAILDHGAPVTFKWIKGHNGDPLNNKADVLALAAAWRAAERQ